jgi:hypothetical protein
VTQCDGTSPRVDVVDTQAEDLCVGFDDCGEGLVELPDGNVGFREAGLLEELLDDGGRSNGKVDGVWAN